MQFVLDPAVYKTSQTRERLSFAPFVDPPLSGSFVEENLQNISF